MSLSVPRVLSNEKITMNIQAKTFAANLRRAQLLATTRGINLSVCTSSTGYSIQAGIDCTGTPITDPAGGAFSVSFKNGAALSGSSLGMPWYFNSAGVPSTGAAYEMKPAAGSSIFIGVAPLTGRVSIN